MTSDDNRGRFPILAMTVVTGIILRICVTYWTINLPISIGDAKEYNEIAVHLVKTGEFGTDLHGPTSIRPPLFPAIVASLYSLFGIENQWAIRTYHGALGILMTLLVYQIARDLFERKTVGYVAAAFACFYPSLLFMETQILTEVTFTFLVVASIRLLQLARQRESILYFACFGICLGLGALTRSVLWLFPIVATAFLLTDAALPTVIGKSVRSSNLICRLAISVVPILFFSIVIAPWTIRNSLLHRTFTTVDVMGGRNLMMGNYEFTPMYRAWDAIGIVGEQSWISVLKAEHPEIGGLTQGQLDKLAMRRGLDYVRHNPVLSLKRSLVKFLNFWQIERTLIAGLPRGYWGGISKEWVIVVSCMMILANVVVLLSGIIGFVSKPPADIGMHLYLIVLIAFVCAVHTLVFGHERYRLPLMPIFMIYAAAILADIGSLWAHRSSRGVRLAALICVIVVGSWVWEIVFIEWPNIRAL